MKPLLLAAVMIFGLAAPIAGRTIEPRDAMLPVPLAFREAAPMAKRSDPATPSTAITQFGYYEIIGGQPYAVQESTWTFDHGAPDPFEGWVSYDVSGGDDIRSAAAGGQRLTATIWSDHGNAGSPPIIAGDASAWIGAHEDEADELCWAGGLGYGDDWCKRYTSPPLTYTGAGSVAFAMRYFCDSEEDFDITRVLLSLGSGAVEVELASFTGVAGNPATSSYVDYNRTITQGEFSGETAFRIVFEFTSDTGWSDEDGAYGTAYGPFGVDNVTLTGGVVGGNQTWDFEGGEDHGFEASSCGTGAHMGVAGVAAYGSPCPGTLSGNVLEFHDGASLHPEEQNEMAVSPIVDLTGFAGVQSITARFDGQFHIGPSSGVFMRGGWQYYPALCAETGTYGWSGRIGTVFYQYTETECEFRAYEAFADGVPASAERVRFIFEVREFCDSPPCTPDHTPIIDNIRIEVEHSGGPPGSISGLVVDDVGADCALAGEAGVAKWFVLLEDGTGLERMTLTDTTGAYSFPGLTAGDYTVSILDRAYWTRTCPADPGVHEYALGDGENATGLDFGVQATPGISDLSVRVASSRPPRPGFSIRYGFTIRNEGTAPADATATLPLPSEVTYNGSVPAGTYDSESHTVTWDTSLGLLKTSAIPPLQSVNYAVYGTVLVTAPLGQLTTLQGTAFVTPPAHDPDLSNNSSIELERIVGSFDPNDKAVSPDSSVSEGQRLDYKIRFQNVGTAEAINIVVRDTLSNDLDITTLALGASSHAYEFAVNGRELVWTFTDINLPDSTSNEPESHGFVEFEIFPHQDLSVGTAVENRGGIYFDFNSVVLTNVTSTEFVGPLAVDESTAQAVVGLRLLAISPNPSGGVSSIRFAAPREGRLTASLFSADGRLVRRLGQRHVAAGTSSLEWDGRSESGRRVAPGVYYVKAELRSPGRPPSTVEGRIVILK